MITSPFDRKNKIASALDRLALRAVILSACVLYFFYLWRNGLPSLLAGGALFALIMLLLMQLQRRTLARRDRMLRERISGMIALENLLLLPNAAACAQVCALLCTAFDAKALDGGKMLYEGETWLVRCAQCLQGSSVSQGDVLGAHRARVESGADRCALASTTGFSPDAVRAAEWADPPIRLISGRQLTLLFGRLHPASDADIAAHLARQKKPFSWQRIRALALSPAKLRRYLLCAALLFALYLTTGSIMSLLSSLLSFALAMLCHRESKKSFLL